MTDVVRFIVLNAAELLLGLGAAFGIDILPDGFFHNLGEQLKSKGDAIKGALGHWSLCTAWFVNSFSLLCTAFGTADHRKFIEVCGWFLISLLGIVASVVLLRSGSWQLSTIPLVWRAVLRGGPFALFLFKLAIIRDLG